VRHLVIGGTGLVGAALVAELSERNKTFSFTSRRHNLGIKFNLELNSPASLPEADIAYLIAAMPGFAICESNPLTWLVNVDAQIALARAFAGPSFVVYVSSDAVEIAGGTAYARQKAAVEGFIHAVGGAIVRPSRIAPERARDFAGVLIKVGEGRKPGVFRWR
jgi:dTDP-4-dehydrorhamnose reductase